MTSPAESAGEPRQTVFVVDDDPAICESLSDLIESAGIATICYASAEEFLAAWNDRLAGCLLLDVRLPGLSGMELLNRIAKSYRAIPIIIMTAHGDIPMVRNAMKAGAVEFLTKPFQDDELLNAIEQAFELNRSQHRARSVEESIEARFHTLSPRERQVMEMVTRGLLNKQIAEHLGLSLVTVKLYRRQVMEKMQADTLADLVKISSRLPHPPASI